MTEMEIHDKEEENEVEAVDPMEKIIEKVADNSDALLTLLDILEKLKEAGIIKLLSDVSQSYLPTDVEFFGKFISSKEFANGIMKTGNVLLALLFALSDERTTDTIKAILFNLPDISKDLVDTIGSGKKQTLVGMYSSIKNDQDLFLGLTASMKAMSRITKSIKKLDYSDPVEKLRQMNQ
jgi:uncharacterized protein YjgD (DUF1641 family)